MKRALFLACALIMCACASLVVGQAKGKKSSRDLKVEQELRALVRQWDEADVKKDVTTLDRLLADEFAFVGGIDKKKYLAFIESGDAGIESAVSDNVKVRVYGATAVLTGLDTIKGKRKGQEYIERYLYMDVWVKRGNRWQCVATQSELLKEK